MKNVIKILTICLLVVIIQGFTIDGDIDIPYSKINKSIKKCQISGTPEVTDTSIYPEISDRVRLFTIVNGNDISGYVYVNRINSCRADGCEAHSPFEGDSFEYFDYYVITDVEGSVLYVKIYNYQATHGHQVMSKGWLRQFIGFNGSQPLEYGQNIQAISGATISAKAITTDIQRAESLIKSVALNTK